MAIQAQGMTFTWGTVALQEVQALDLDLTRGLPVGRVTTWTPSLGTIRLASFSRFGLPVSEYGQRRTLTILGRPNTVLPAETIFQSDCIFEDARVEAVANDVFRFAFTFRIQDTLGAPSIT
jgi:hypothetical protein